MGVFPRKGQPGKRRAAGTPHPGPPCTPVRGAAIHTLFRGPDTRSGLLSLFRQEAGGFRLLLTRDLTGEEAHRANDAAEGPLTGCLLSRKRLLFLYKRSSLQQLRDSSSDKNETKHLPVHLTLRDTPDFRNPGGVSLPFMPMWFHVSSVRTSAPFQETRSAKPAAHAFPGGSQLRTVFSQQETASHA